MSDNVYIGRDLEAMSFAVNYHRWILSRFKPYLGDRLVEVGAGTGLFSKLLLELSPKTISLVEPSTGMYGILADRIPLEGGRVEAFNKRFVDIAAHLRESQRPDSIIYVNVLEHILEDELELRTVFETLTEGGRTFIFVPALPALYGNFDKEVGHFRRYTKQELENKCTAAGLKVIESIYFDVLGVLPWWFEYRIRKASALDPNKVRLYDRLVVPLAKFLEAVIRPPIGKNILLIAEKQ